MKLSFAIQKVPERKKIEVEPPKSRKKAKTKEVEESKAVEVGENDQKGLIKDAFLLIPLL